MSLKIRFTVAESNVCRYSVPYNKHSEMKIERQHLEKLVKLAGR